MRIAIIGHGKMGQMIAQVAKERLHTITAIVDTGADNIENVQPSNSDVAIEFTTPDAAPGNVHKLLNAGVPVICGSTGWNDKLAEIKHLSQYSGVPFMHASNFSIGVNIFFRINSLLAQYLADDKSYTVNIEEIHHVHKKDAPSGTAITLANGIIAQSNHYSEWHLHSGTANDDVRHSIAIMDKRLGEVPGTHHVKYTSHIDDLEIIHTAHNRQGFAMGAVRCAEWILDKKGYQGIDNFINEILAKH